VSALVNAAAMLALNQAHVTETSSLDMASMQALIDAAFYMATCERGGKDAFLLAVDQDADYSSPNFLWFRARYPRFVYIDRVIVAERQRQKGWARRFYAGLFEAAVAAGHTVVACEVNAAPPNLASEAFHTALGFDRVGQAETADRTKTVTYLVREAR
jgi:predicted GNAT superfamily acetyltransferase